MSVSLLQQGFLTGVKFPHGEIMTCQITFILVNLRLIVDLTIKYQPVAVFFIYINMLIAL